MHLPSARLHAASAPRASAALSRSSRPSLLSRVRPDTLRASHVRTPRARSALEALVLERPGRIAAHAAADPGRPGPGEALVRAHRVGVAGSDLRAFRGHHPFFTYPRVLGQELGVEVLAIGRGVAGVAPGDRCAVEPYLNCGHCASCRRGQPHCCAWMQVLGVDLDGGMRPRFVVPAAKLHVSRELSYDRLAGVAPLAQAMHAIRRAALDSDETVAIIGAGPVGLAVTHFARALGCRAIMIDSDARRLAFGRDRLGLPGDDLVNASTIDASDRVLELTGGDLPSAVFDTTGESGSMAASLALPAQGGRLVYVGTFAGDLTFHVPGFQWREITLLASRNAGPDDFRRVIALAEAGAVDTSSWITHRASIADAPAQFSAWASPAAAGFKAMIHLS